MVIKIKRRRVPLDEKQKRQRQLAIIALFVAAALFFLGFSIGKKNTEPKTEAKTEDEISIVRKPSRSQVTEVGPTNFDGIVPTGFDHSEEGAKKAAATYVEAWAQLILTSDAEVITAIDFITTPEANELRTSLANNITTARASLRDAIAGQIYHQSVPMKIKVESYDSKNATISIWSSEFWAAAGEFEPQVNFDFQELKLVYVGNDWKIDSWITTPGPTPKWSYRDEPMGSIDFLSALAGYEEYKR